MMLVNIYQICGRDLAATNPKISFLHSFSCTCVVLIVLDITVLSFFDLTAALLSTPEGC